MKSQKEVLRAGLKQRRLEMTDADRTLKSQAIVANLKRVINWSEVKNLHYFEPIKGLLEPEISPLVTYLEDNYPDLKMFTPRKISGSWNLIAVRGSAAPEKFDVILVPMLGFDKKLDRIGYGGGYYDRLLAMQPQAKKIGVCYEAGQVEKIPTESHDMRLDSIVTEQTIFTP